MMTQRQRLRAQSLRRKARPTKADVLWLEWYERNTTSRNATPADAGDIDDAEPVWGTADAVVLVGDAEPETESDAAPPVTVAGTVQRATRSEIVDDALRSAVNAQVAAVEMMELACRAALAVATAASSQVSGLVMQLVDAHTALAEAGQERLHAQVQTQEAMRQADTTKVQVQEEIEKRIIDGVFPSKRSE
jgi:metal-responsive CopG/Arc/MetJ family transcriptional regulator